MNELGVHKGVYLNTTSPLLDMDNEETGNKATSLNNNLANENQIKVPKINLKIDQINHYNNNVIKKGNRRSDSNCSSGKLLSKVNTSKTNLSGSGNSNSGELDKVI